MVTPARETDTRPAFQSDAPAGACPTPTAPPCEPVNARRAMLAGIGGLAAGALLAGKANAGPLAPPPGPIAPTPGPEPRTAINAINTPGNASAIFRITQPGSYYLEGNITGALGKHGIVVTTSGVTIDLMGFSLIGVPDSLDGIRTTTNNLSNISILNGSIQEWGDSGINLSSSLARNGRIERVSAFGNGSVGINAGSAFAVISCTAANNQSNGFVVAFDSVIINCVATNNRSGFGLSPGCIISNCTASGNTRDGIFVFSTCLIKNNVCRGNGTSGNGAGIEVSSIDNRIEDNSCISNRIGINCLAPGNFIARNTCSGSTTQNWNVGANNACLVVNAALAPAISGNSGGASPGSTNPYANFTF